MDTKEQQALIDEVKSCYKRAVDRLGYQQASFENQVDAAHRQLVNTQIKELDRRIGELEAGPEPALWLGILSVALTFVPVARITQALLGRLSTDRLLGRVLPTLRKDLSKVKSAHGKLRKQKKPPPLKLEQLAAEKVKIENEIESTTTSRTIIGNYLRDITPEVEDTARNGLRSAIALCHVRRVAVNAKLKDGHYRDLAKVVNGQFIDAIYASIDELRRLERLDADRLRDLLPPTASLASEDLDQLRARREFLEKIIGESVDYTSFGFIFGIQLWCTTFDFTPGKIVPGLKHDWKPRNNLTLSILPLEASDADRFLPHKSLLKHLVDYFPDYFSNQLDEHGNVKTYAEVGEAKLMGVNRWSPAYLNWRGGGAFGWLSDPVDDLLRSGSFSPEFRLCHDFALRYYPEFNEVLSDLIDKLDP